MIDGGLIHQTAVIVEPGLEIVHFGGCRRHVAQLATEALRRLVAGDLAGLFDGPSTVRFDPSLPLAFRLAATFDCTIEDLFFPDEED